VDGIEKMHYELNPDGHSSHSQLFVQHAEQLRAPECHIIYTVPVSLAYNQNLGADFDSITVLPMVKMDDGGIQQLIEVIQQRVEVEDVFENIKLVETFAKVSGGVVRDLMRLIRMSTDTDNEKITASDTEYAINTLKQEYDRLVSEEDIESFKQIVKTKHIQQSKNRPHLLNLRLVLEYRNGELWADLHPILYQIKWIKEALAQEDLITLE